jgi:Lar family restriction alleviation protein
MNEELLPCPFCGSSAIIIEIDGYRPSSPKTYRAFCTNDDGIASLEFDTEAEAIEWWNRRTTPPASCT